MIGSTVASLPIKLFYQDEKGVQEIHDRRTYLLNADTGDTLDPIQMKKAVIKDYYLGHGGYIYIDRSGTFVRSLRYVDESRVSFYTNTDAIFKDYQLSVDGRRFERYDFIELLRNTKNGAYGIPITEEKKTLFNTAYNTLKYENMIVSTGGNKKGFLTTAHRLSADAITALKTAWKNLYANNSDNVVVLNEGMDFKESSNTSVEMQLNENKKANDAGICKAFTVPYSMLSGPMTEEDEKRYIKYTIPPVMDAIETALNRYLLLETEKSNYFFQFDTTELNKADIDKRYACYKTAIDSGFMMLDEVRAKENLPNLGLNFVKLNLADGLYYPADGTVYTLNTDSKIKMSNRTVSNTVIVSGATGSGKSTWVKSHMGKKDMMIDFEKIRESVTGEPHSDNESVLNTVMTMRNAAFKTLETGDLINATCYITTTQDEGKVKSMAKRFGAEIHTMKATFPDCVRNIMRDETRKDKKKYIELARKWYEDRGIKTKEN